MRRRAAYRSPSRFRTTSTRCSSVFGPAIVPSLVTCPARITAVPVAFAYAMRRTVASRTCPTLPAAPSSSSTVAVCTESTTRTAGASDVAASTIAPMSCSARIRTRSPAGPASTPSRPARRWTWVVDSSPWRTGRPDRRRHCRRWRRGPGASASTCRSPARRRAGRPNPGPGRHRAPGRARRSRRGRAACRSARWTRGGRPRPHRWWRDSVAARRPWACGRRSRRGCSTCRRSGTGPPNAGRPRHRSRRRSGSRAAPCQRAGAIGAPMLRPRPASAVSRRRGCRDPLRGPCPPRWSSRARSGQAAGARRARPRPCSG